MAVLFGVFESAEERAAGAYTEELVQLCESGADRQTLNNACSDLRKGGHLLKEKERQKLVAPLLSVLDDTVKYDDVTHREVILLLGRLRRPEVIPALLACLKREDRLLGQARGGLPVVEEWARHGGGIVARSPTQEFLYPLLKLPERVEDSALNQYFVRVLFYPPQSQRIEAIQFLLQKDGTDKEAAFAAAIDILEHLRPDKDNRFVERDREFVLCALQKYGGARGKALAAAYDRR